MSMHGGKREGAGRPKGSSNKLKFTDFFTPEDMQLTVEKAKELVDKGDRDIIKYVLDQFFGKAVQSTELSGKDGEPLQILFDEIFQNKRNETSRETEGDN